jgi:hypothetical protein
MRKPAATSAPPSRLNPVIGRVVAGGTGAGLAGLAEPAGFPEPLRPGAGAVLCDAAGVMLGTGLAAGRVGIADGACVTTGAGAVCTGLGGAALGDGVSWHPHVGVAQDAGQPAVVAQDEYQPAAPHDEGQPAVAPDGDPPGGSARAVPAEVMTSTAAIPVAATVGATHAGRALQGLGSPFSGCPVSGG